MGPDPVRPYVRNTVQLLYTPDNPPPKEPPAELEMPNPGPWRVLAMWWYDHQPDEGGRICRYCNRWYPCPGVVSADGGFRTAIRHAHERRRPRGVAKVFYQKGRNI
ncbi:MAG: hypothetical protein ACRDTM_14105 [Micromonosporaceae bacterium]